LGGGEGHGTDRFRHKALIGTEPEEKKNPDGVQRIEIERAFWKKKKKRSHKDQVTKTDIGSHQITGGMTNWRVWSKKKTEVVGGKI